MQILRRVIDWVIRRKLALHETPLDRFQVRLAKTAEEYRAAFRLVHAGYVFQGIESVRDSHIRLTAQHLLPQAKLILVYEGEDLVGTMTVTLDSSEGLPLDKDFGEDLDKLRARGAVLAEYNSLAVVERCWHAGVTNLINMAASQIARSLGADHCVIGVHPSAARFMKAAFAFEGLGPPRKHALLEAPVIGLVHNLRLFETFFRQKYRRPMATGLLPIEHISGAPLPCVNLPADISGKTMSRPRFSTAVTHEFSQSIRSRCARSLSETRRASLAGRRQTVSQIQPQPA